MTQPGSPRFVALTGYQPEPAARIRVPGSKSITNRALLVAALAEGRSVLRRPLFSEDTDAMRDCLDALGVKVELLEDGDLAVTGSGRLAAPSRTLFVGNAGTVARFLTAAAALVDGKVELDGNSYMRKRPIGPLTEALGALGLDVTSTEGCMPVTVAGQGALAAQAERPVIGIDAGYSSQYVSALMMAGPMMPRGLDLRLTGAKAIDAAGYLDVTTDTMAAFGVAPVLTEPGRWVFDPAAYQARDYQIEPDYSACTYFWAAQALCPTEIEIEACDAEATRQPDAKSEAVMRLFPDMPAEIDGSQMQDAVPTLAVLAAFNRTPVRFVGIANLRVKECDRIAAVESGLNRIRPGLAVVEGDDLTVTGGLEDDPQAAPVEIDSFDDHRIAMAFALVALRRANVVITNPRCVEKTFPDYWTELAKLGVTAEFSG
ncbi:3-phosphoshikimate 1-carboxyvinyltransferase [Poseidonocella sp. HB161398]|uniref:3-phosphoshikimate 1-carboxyvinyltransferase n=1 Tax=Poseidonocella sp. HB161398 TaxID=2320855 RepID=UPI001107BA4F|nr:3-phosphoshikimate 1-carboxyvinyltransferase [Poseidonocella sp. HB161398]